LVDLYAKEDNLENLHGIGFHREIGFMRRISKSWIPRLSCSP